MFGYGIDLGRGTIKTMESWNALGALTTSTGFVSLDSLGVDARPGAASTSANETQSGGRRWGSRNDEVVRPGGNSTTSIGIERSPKDSSKQSSAFSGKGHILGAAASDTISTSRGSNTTLLMKRLEDEKIAKQEAGSLGSMGSGMHLDRDSPIKPIKYERELSEMVSMGFSSEESRKALIECHGNVTDAVALLS